MKEGVEKLSTTGAVEVGLVRVLSFDAGAEGVHGQVVEVLGVVVLAGGKGVEAAGKAVDGRIEVDVIVIGEDDVKVAVQLGRGQFVKALGDEGDADEIALGALHGRGEVSAHW